MLRLQLLPLILAFVPDILLGHAQGNDLCSNKPAVLGSSVSPAHGKYPLNHAVVITIDYNATLLHAVFVSHEGIQIPYKGNDCYLTTYMHVSTTNLCHRRVVITCPSGKAADGGRYRTTISSASSSANVTVFVQPVSSDECSSDHTCGQYGLCLGSKCVCFDNHIGEYCNYSCNPLDNFYSDDKIEMDRGCSLQKYLICPTEDYADSVWYFNKREVKRGTRLYDLNITGKGIEDDIVECYVNGTQLLRTVVVGRGGPVFDPDQLRKFKENQPLNISADTVITYPLVANTVPSVRYDLYPVQESDPSKLDTKRPPYCLVHFDGSRVRFPVDARCVGPYNWTAFNDFNQGNPLMLTVQVGPRGAPHSLSSVAKIAIIVSVGLACIASVVITCVLYKHRQKRAKGYDLIDGSNSSERETGCINSDGKPGELVVDYSTSYSSGTIATTSSEQASPVSSEDSDDEETGQSRVQQETSDKPSTSNMLIHENSFANGGTPLSSGVKEATSPASCPGHYTCAIGGRDIQSSGELREGEENIDIATFPKQSDSGDGDSNSATDCEPVLPVCVTEANSEEGEVDHTTPSRIQDPTSNGDVWRSGMLVRNNIHSDAGKSLLRDNDFFNPDGTPRSSPTDRSVSQSLSVLQDTNSRQAVEEATADQAAQADIETEATQPLDSTSDSPPAPIASSTRYPVLVHVLPQADQKGEASDMVKPAGQPNPCSVQIDINDLEAQV